MGYAILAIVGFFCGALLSYLLLETRRASFAAIKLHTDNEKKQLRAAWIDLSYSQEQHNQQLQDFESAKIVFNNQFVNYQTLFNENIAIKKDLAVLHQKWRKTYLDQSLQHKQQQTLYKRIQELGTSYLRDQVKWIGNSLNPSNYATCKQKLLTAIERCREIGLAIPSDEEASLLNDLKNDYELIVRTAIEREEQARIRCKYAKNKNGKKTLEAVSQASEADEDAGDVDERLVEIGFSFVAHGESSGVLEPGEGAFDLPAAFVTREFAASWTRGFLRFLRCGQIRSTPRMAKRARSGSLSAARS
ncbi:MAG: hypothetical protein QM811_05190 [Pirellulales bacterium]